MVTPSTSKDDVSKKTGAHSMDNQTKIERSRENARECRRRKKLRYQYLESLVSCKERAVLKLREEIETVRINVMKLWLQGCQRRSSFTTDGCMFTYSFSKYRYVSEKVDSGILPDTLFQIVDKEGNIDKCIKTSSDNQNNILGATLKSTTNENLETNITGRGNVDISSTKQDSDSCRNALKLTSICSGESLLPHDLYTTPVVDTMVQSDIKIQCDPQSSAFDSPDCSVRQIRFSDKDTTGMLVLNSRMSSVGSEVVGMAENHFENTGTTFKTGERKDLHSIKQFKHKDSDEEIVDWILQNEPPFPQNSPRRTSATRMEFTSQSSVDSMTSSEEMEVEHYVNYLKDVSDLPSSKDEKTNRNFMENFIRKKLLENENDSIAFRSDDENAIPSSNQPRSVKVSDENTYAKFPVLSTLLTEDDN